MAVGKVGNWCIEKSKSMGHVCIELIWLQMLVNGNYCISVLKRNVGNFIFEMSLSEMSGNFYILNVIWLMLVSVSGRRLHSTVGPIQPGQLGHVDLHRRRPEVFARKVRDQLHTSVLQVFITWIAFSNLLNEKKLCPWICYADSKDLISHQAWLFHFGNEIRKFVNETTVSMATRK